MHVVTVFMDLCSNAGGNDEVRDMAQDSYSNRSLSYNCMLSLDSHPGPYPGP